MESEVVLWGVVLFPNGGTATVLASWFNPTEGTLLWPPKNTNYSKALKEHMVPRKGWTTYENIRLLITCDSFEKAKQHEEKYVNTGCLTTDLESEEEADVRRKRRARANPVHAVESDEEAENSSVKRRFAKPPDVHFPVLPESSQYPLVPTLNASSVSGGSCSAAGGSCSASGGSCSEDNMPNNGFGGSFLAQLESMDPCNDGGNHTGQVRNDFAGNHHHPQGYQGMPMYNSSPYHTVPSEQARNDFDANNARGSRSADFRSPGLGSGPETPRGRFHGGEPSQMLQDIAANKNTRMLTELLMEVKQMSRDIQFIKTEMAKSTFNNHGAGPESQREDNFPIVLPLTNEEQFDEAEAALKEETVRRKMTTRLALVGGTNPENMIRRMLSTTMTNSLASIFNWAGKGQKRAFKDTLMQDCMFAAARQFDRKLTELLYRDALQKWLRYAPERNGGVPRKEKPKS